MLLKAIELLAQFEVSEPINNVTWPEEFVLHK